MSREVCEHNVIMNGEHNCQVCNSLPQGIVKLQADRIVELEHDLLTITNSTQEIMKENQELRKVLKDAEEALKSLNYKTYFGEPLSVKLCIQAIAKIDEVLSQ